MNNRLAEALNAPLSTPAYIGVTGLLNQMVVTNICTHINVCAERGHSPIVLMINSAGGSPTDGVYLYNFLKMHSAHVVTYNAGNCESAALTAFLGGKVRVSAPNGLFMMHPVTLGSAGPERVGKYEANVQGMRLEEARIDGILKLETKLSDNLLKRRSRTEVYFDANTALKHGIVGQVTTMTAVHGAFVVQVPIV